MCVHVNLLRWTPPPMPLCSCQQPPSSHFWLGGSWGLTFHFSDPLFHRANSYAGLEMCYVAGWDKNQGQFQNNLWPLSQGYFCSLPLLDIHFTDLISIMNLSVNKDIFYIQRMFIIKQKTWQSSMCFSLLLSLKFISYLLHKPILHISSRVFFCIHTPFQITVIASSSCLFEPEEIMLCSCRWFCFTIGWVIQH